MEMRGRQMPGGSASTPRTFATRPSSPDGCVGAGYALAAGEALGRLVLAVARLADIPGFNIDRVFAAAGDDPEVMRLENLDTDLRARGGDRGDEGRRRSARTAGCPSPAATT